MTRVQPKIPCPRLQHARRVLGPGRVRSGTPREQAACRGRAPDVYGRPEGKGYRMCGIAGLVLGHASPVRPQLEALSKALAHRGPDDCGFLLWNGREVVKGTDVPDNAFAAGLVHRRLAILDLSRDAWQPMSTPDGRYHVVYNGEIYNFLELRAELEASGHVFRTRSDTEVLLAAWAAWGPGALVRFVGMFAFALLDVEEEILYLARDCFGIKPLYYTRFGRAQDGFAFASEIPPLLQLPGVSRKVNPTRAYRYLRFGVTDDSDETLFSAIRQVPAAHYLVLPLRDTSHTRVVRYWKLELKEPADLSFQEAVSRLRELFLQSVALHLRSDVPVGAALSGGIDSSAVVTAMRHLEPDLEFHTVSFLADGKGLSEEGYVDTVASVVGARCHKFRITPDELVEDLDTLIRTQGEPFGSTSVYAQHRMFRLAHEMGIRVMLDGQGADELLAGYIAQGAARVVSLLAQGRLQAAVKLARALSRLPGRKDIYKRILIRLVPPSLQPVALRLGGESVAPDWLNEQWLAAQGVDLHVPSKVSGRAAGRLREELYQALTSTSLPALLRYADRNSMAYAVESRVPFLTPDLAQFLLHLPEDYLIGPDGTSKLVFREAMRGLVPDPVLDRREKLGFVTPELNWLRSLRPWIECQLSGEVARSIPLLRPDGLLNEWRNVIEGRRPFDFRVWRWVDLIAWTRAFEVDYS